MFAESIMKLRYSWTKEDGELETWDDIAERVVEEVMKTQPEVRKTDMKTLIKQRKFIPGGRFLAQAGRPYHQTNNCFLLRAEDTREGWGELMQKSTVMLMSGGGIGVDYSAIRPNGAPLKRSGGTSSGPLPLMKTINEIGRGVMSGGKRRSAIWAGLVWDHPDILDFIKVKNWLPEVIKLKEKDFDFPAPMDMTNISVILDKRFFDAYDNPDNPQHEHAVKVYNEVVHRMCKTGEPGFSVNYDDPTESLRNACTEIVSDKDCDVCCIGSINLANIEDTNELMYVTTMGVYFLMCGTDYSDVPFPKVKEVREEYRRIGLGIMGIAEWLAVRGYDYAMNSELREWLGLWRESSVAAAKFYAKKLGMNVPVKIRAIAPNGTTSIAGGLTTSGIEPIFAVAYKRRYLSPDGWRMQYVVDPVAEKLYEMGVDPTNIEDAYALSLNVEKRIKFQADVQDYVDNSISSTVNLPAYGTPGNDDEIELRNTLYKYLPRLRGITFYPDGGRGGQPLTPVDFHYARERKGVIYEGNEECVGGVCGI